MFQHYALSSYAFTCALLIVYYYYSYYWCLGKHTPPDSVRRSYERCLEGNQSEGRRPSLLVVIVQCDLLLILISNNSNEPKSILVIVIVVMRIMVE